MVLSDSVRGCTGGLRELTVESSESSVVSRLLIEGVTAPGSTVIGFGRRAFSWSGALRRCIDLLNAKVDFIVSMSESLLSDGMRLCPAGETGVAPRGKAEGHRVFLAS